jgi:hypothetical protein
MVTGADGFSFRLMPERTWQTVRTRTGPRTFHRYLTFATPRWSVTPALESMRRHRSRTKASSLIRAPEIPSYPSALSTFARMANVTTPSKRGRVVDDDNVTSTRGPRMRK